MGLNTGIDWAAASWNPWQGCKKVSSGCAACYMHREKTRYGQDPNYVIRSKAKTFNAPLRWAQTGALPDGARIFVCSWSDFWIEEADAWRDEAWQIICHTPYVYLIPTKRPARMLAWCEHNLVPDNVWLAVSVENQATAQERIPLLLQCDAKVRWVSAEPLLGPLMLDGAAGWLSGENLSSVRCRPRLHWVVCGSESGSNRRPCSLDWIRSLRDQCRETGVPFFLKQADIDGTLMKVPELDGRQWLEFPANPQC